MFLYTVFIFFKYILFYRMNFLYTVCFQFICFSAESHADVVVTTNRVRVIPPRCLALVGGLGFVPSARIRRPVRAFEPVHGRPLILLVNIVNPVPQLGARHARSHTWEQEWCRADRESAIRQAVAQGIPTRANSADISHPQLRRRGPSVHSGTASDQECLASKPRWGLCRSTPFPIEVYKSGAWSQPPCTRDPKDISRYLFYLNGKGCQDRVAPVPPD